MPAATATALHFVLPLPPSVNNLYTNVPQHNRRVLTEHGRVYKLQCGYEVRNVAAHAGWSYPEAARLALTFRFFFRDNHRRDITNHVKVVEDAIAEALHFDDSHVDRVLIERAGVDRNTPRCEVTLEVL